ncbi:MAG: TolC family protein [Gemmatimonadota bacterium]|nr:MAG: TolC family protein [Gemmatimonadota bacterium]
MKWRAVPSALLACLLVAVTNLSAQQVARLTLEEAIELARQNNPLFQQTMNDVAPAQWNVRAANANLFLPDASLAFGVGWQDAGQERLGSFTSSQPSVKISNYSFSLSYLLNGQTLFAPGQRRAERNAVERRIDDADLQLRNSITSFYIEVLRLEARAEQSERELRRSEEHLRLAEAREEVGAGTRLETMQADLARGQAEVALVQAQNSARVAKLRLIQALGVQMPADQIELVSEFEIFALRLDLEDWIADAMAAHPSLVAARADRQAANSSVKVAKASYFPTLSLRASWSGFTRQETNPDFTIESRIASERWESAAAVEGCNIFAELYEGATGSIPPEFSDCTQYEFTEQDSIDIDTSVRARNDVFPFDFENSPVSLSAYFSLPLFQGFDRQVQVEQAVARRNDLDYFVRGLELQIRADVTEAVHNLETAYQTVLLQEENTATAREEMRLAQERYQLGAGTFLELLDSQTLTAQAEVDQIEAVFSFHQSLTALEAAVGRPLDVTGRE